MRLPGWVWLALCSLSITHAIAATRPHYGGSLTVELSTGQAAPDPSQWNTALSIPITETLVRLNPRGVVEPVLSVAWQHDPDLKRWRFSLRQKVTFHDGEPLNGATAAPSLLGALKKKYANVSVQTGGQAIVIQSSEPMPDILSDLAEPPSAIVRQNDTDPLIGTGPFRITAWEPGRRWVVAAFDDYWGSRPYLDSIAIEFGAAGARADIFDIPAGPSRRILPEGIGTWSSEPRSLVAITAADANPTLLEALALVVDRAPIVNVLAQRRGEAAFSLLPQWLSGYAFLFQSMPDVSRAKQLVSKLRLGPISLSYPPNDPFRRSVAERIALNARDAGIAIQPTPNTVNNPGGNLRLVELQLTSADAAVELKRLSGQAIPLDSAKPEALYEFERSLLADHRVIPLVYLRETYGIAPRVHIESSKPDAFALHLEDVWLQP